MTADRAVDGDSLTTDAGSCYHSVLNDKTPYWAVDLGCMAYIQSVTITNRGDCCGNM